MPVPDDRRYLPTHEWHLVDGDVCTIGITRFAADELTDVTYVDLPAEGATVTAGEPFGEIESVKATSDLVSGVTGEVVEVNAALGGDPSLVNTDPHDPESGGWMIRVRMSDPSELDALLDASAYASETGAN